MMPASTEAVDMDEPTCAIEWGRVRLRRPNEDPEKSSIMGGVETVRFRTEKLVKQTLDVET